MRSNDDGGHAAKHSNLPKVLLLALLCALASFQLHAVDIGPNTPNGTVTPSGGPETGGQPIALAGDSSNTYLVTFNAGIWKSVGNGPWVQIPNSPPYAYSIAVDPNNAAHLAVGERGGDAIYGNQNVSGVWESVDGAATWTKVLDPLTRPGGCSTQAMPAVAFTNNSTLVAAGPCGIAVRPSGMTNFSWPTLPAGIDEPFVRALSVSRTKIWARTYGRLLVSTNNGTTWTLIKPVPPEFESYPSAGDDFALAAFDSMAFIGAQKIWPGGGNVALLRYAVASDSWSIQQLTYAGAPVGDGTGCGGRKFIKAIDLKNPGLPDVLGQRLQLFAGAGQEVYKANGTNPDGSVSSWTRVGITAGVCTEVYDDPIHVDLWDFHIAPDASRVWFVDDGGVHSKAWPSGSWATYNQDLFTHYVDMLTVLHTGPGSPAKLVYATPDNDAWDFDSAGGWHKANKFGDGTWTDGDTGNPRMALMSRVKDNSWLTSFSANLFGGNRYLQLVLTNDLSFTLDPSYHRFQLQLIQTLSGESPTYPNLDAVMLANLPLLYRNAANNLVPVPGPLGQPSGVNPVLIRNTALASYPDINVSRGAGWQLVYNDLPSQTKGFWVSGGHAQPVYYVYAVQSGVVKLYRRIAAGWQLLNPQINNDNDPSFQLVDAETFGPAFVNPYNPNRLYVLTNSGIKVSADGGNSFQDEVTLTQLITASGKFPMTGNFRGGNGNFLPRGMGSHAREMGTLSHLAFDRDDPSRVVAASPFTGVFYTSGDGNWADLTISLPKPFTAVTAVGIDNEDIYVGTGGRALQRTCHDPAVWYRDADGDGHGNPSVRIGICDGSGPPGYVVESTDCNDANPGVFAVPNESFIVAAAKVPPATAAFTFSPANGGSSTVYDVVRGDLGMLPVGPGGGDEAAACGLAGATFSIAAGPAPGHGYWVLVRGKNACGTGSYGHQGAHAAPGIERQTSTCP